ncbi:MAG: ATP-binding protein [Leptospira sp.]|nr:ATP-binding protein [Leptospira sp.]
MIPQKDNRLSIPKSMDSLSIIRNNLRKFLIETSFDSKQINSIVLSVDEAITNIIEHGKSIQSDDNIEINVHYDGKTIELNIEDHCEHFNPLASEIANPYTFINEGNDGGMGIYSYRTLMDVRYQPIGDKMGNRLILRYPKMEKT